MLYLNRDANRLNDGQPLIHVKFRGICVDPPVSDVLLFWL